MVSGSGREAVGTKRQVWTAGLALIVLVALVSGPVGAVAATRAPLEATETLGSPPDVAAVGEDASTAPPAESAGPWATLVGPAFVRFVPGTQSWDLQFGVVGDGWGAAQPVLVSAKASLDGRACDPSLVGFCDSSWALASGRITEAEVSQLQALRAARAQGLPLLTAEPQAIEEQAVVLSDLLAKTEPATLSVAHVGAVPPGSHQLVLVLTYDVGGQTVALSSETEVLLAALPPSNGWYPADLHTHSAFSDGYFTSVADLRAYLATQGYSIGYVTDHVKSLLRFYNRFEDMTDTYPWTCRTASTDSTWMFPGAELTLSPTKPESHALAYGLANLAGLTDNVALQSGLDAIGANSPVSSSALAHPVSAEYPWTDLYSTNFQGLELMSGWQLDCGRYSDPAIFWLAECERLRKWAGSLDGNPPFLPSVRTGSDYHFFGLSFVTYVKLQGNPTTWEGRLAAVDVALKYGRTVASEFGSLAYITLNGSPVGSFLNLAAGDPMTFTVSFRPVVAGSYGLTLYRDFSDEVWSTNLPAQPAGTSLSWTVNTPALTGRHYYWLYVDGFDRCYTTPIYVTASPSEPPGSARVDNCQANPSTVSAGQQVTFDLWFTNTGAATRIFPISLYLYPPSGVAFEVGCPQVQVAPGSQGHATWTYTVPQGGAGSWDALYTIWNEPEQDVVVKDSGRLENHFTVEQSQPPTTSLRIDNHWPTPATATVGQTMFFDLYYTNAGATTASCAVSLSLRNPQGQIIDLYCAPGTLAPGAQGHYTWTFTSCESQEGSWAANYTIWTDILKSSRIASTDWQNAYFTILPAQPPPASFRIDGHCASGRGIPVGQTVSFDFYCTNTGTATVPHAVSLSLRDPLGRTIDLGCWPGSLTPGAQGHYQWTFTSCEGQEGSWAAEYTIWTDSSRSVRLGGTGWQSEYFTILPAPPPASVRFDRHRPFPPVTCVGHPMWFEVFLTNTGAAPVSLAVSLTIRSPSGQTMDLPPFYTATLAPDVQGDYDWSYTPEVAEAGSWDVNYRVWTDRSKSTLLASTGWQTGYFTVLATPPPASLSIDSHRAYPKTAGIGQPVCFDLYCTNTGIVTETIAASLTLRGPSGQLVDLVPDYMMRFLPGVQRYGFWVYSAKLGEDGSWDAKYSLWSDASKTTLLATTDWLDGYFTVLPPEPPTPPSARMDSFGATPRTLDVGQPVSFEMWLTNNGTVTWTYVSSLTLTSPSGQVVRILPDQELRVGPGNQGQALWTYTPTEAGTWDAVYEVWKDTGHAMLLASSGLQSDYLTVSSRLVFAETGGSTVVTEGGLGDTYTVALAGQPAAPVTVTLTGDKVTALSVTGSSTLVFGPGNWDVPQTVLVTAVDDAVVEGPHSGMVRHTAPAGSGVPTASMTVGITDNDAPTIVLSEAGGSTAVTEGGTSDTYSVRLGAQPSGPVTVTAFADSQVRVTNSLGGSTLSFTTANWSIPQTLTVRAVDDTLLEGPHFGIIGHMASGGAYGGAPAVALVVTITDNDRPPAPGILAANTSSDGVRLNWLAPSGFVPNGYEVYVKTSSTGTRTKVKEVTAWAGASPNCEVTALDFAGTGLVFTAGRAYYFQVAAFVDLSGGARAISLASNTASAVAGPVPPLAPRTLTATSSADGVRLNWLAPATGVTPQGYEVYIAGGSTGPFTTLAKTVTSWDGANPNCEVTAADLAGTGFTLSGGRTYYFQVKGYYVHPIAGRLVSPASNTASAVAGPTPPLAPTSLTAATSATGVHLGWAVPVSGVAPQGYDVSIATVSTGPWTLVKSVTSWEGAGSNCEVTVLDFSDGHGGSTYPFTVGRTYYFRVYSYIVHPIAGRLTSGPTTAASAKAGPAAPGVPTTPTATTTPSGPATGIRLGWKPPTTAATIPPAGYSVWISASSTGAYTFVKDVTSWTGTDPNCDVTVLDFNGPGQPVFALKGGVRYYFRVYSYIAHPLDGSRIVSASSASTSATAGPAAPGAPTTPTASTTASGPATGIHLAWKPPTTVAAVPPAGYSVWISASSTGTYTFVKDVTSWSGAFPSCDITVLDFNGAGQPVFGFMGGVRYYFRVFSHIVHPLDGSRVSSTAAASAHATAGPPAPGAPTSAKAATAPLGVTLNWRPPTTAATVPPAGYAVWISTAWTGTYTYVKDVTGWEGTYPNATITAEDLDGDDLGGGVVEPVFAFSGAVRYYFRIYAFTVHEVDGSHVPSTAAASTYGTAGPLPPNAPTSPVVAAASDGFTLRWTPPATGTAPTGYRIELIRSSTLGFVLLPDLGWSGTGPSIAVTGADIAAAGLTYTPGATYYARIHSFAPHPLSGDPLVSVGYASASVVAGPVPPNAPSYPTGRTNPASSGGGVNLSWRAPTSGPVPAGYQVYASATSFTGFVLVKDVGSWTGTYPNCLVFAADFTSAGLTMTPGARYYFRVFSYTLHPATGAPVLSLRFGSAYAVAG